MTSDTKVEFHIVNAEKNGAAHYLAELAETLYSKKSLLIYTQSSSEAEFIDEMLWTFSKASFLPHHIVDSNGHSAPILISHHSLSVTQNVLINLADEIPPGYQQFKEVIEVVYEDEFIKKLCRQKYKQYQIEGCSINTIKSLYPKDQAGII